MPFILQCPYCKKYMMLEDDQRGCRVKCLIPACQQWIDQEPSGSSERAKAGPAAATPPPVPAAARARSPAASPATAAPAVLAAQRQRIVQCPKCHTPLRVPPAERSQTIRCPKCQQVFQG
jgi:uncharacterized protein YbaR (Trm112 family)